MTAQRQPETVTAPDVKARIAAGAEFALLDLREEGVYAGGHPLYAVSLPLSRLELHLAKLVPRRSTRIVIYDDNDGLTERAWPILQRFGYTNVAVLSGGVTSWGAWGYESFSGMNVPSKALAEAIEHFYETPHIEARELKAKIDAGADVVVLDSRPLDEYTRMSIPGAIDCPGAELVYRAHDLIRDPATLIVVNCAGRTRSIIGAQSLINSGIANRVVALKNGTMGWKLAGLDLAHGAKHHAPAPGAEGLAKARSGAAAVAARFGVRTLDRAGLDRFRGESEQRTLYVFDGRSPQEYERGHLPDARSAPGGQLVQATDRFAGVRGARIVLVDDDGVRANMTASWLVQLGAGDVYVLTGAWQNEAQLATGPEPSNVLGLDDARPPQLDAHALRPLIDEGAAVVIDLDTSLNFRKAHIPGAWFAIRSRFAHSLRSFTGPATLVLTSSDGTLARLAAREAAENTTVPVKVLAGGTQAWKAAGFPTQAGDEHALDPFDDLWYKPTERAGDAEQIMREYLEWETGLNAQLLRDGDAPFLHLLKTPAHAGHP